MRHSIFILLIISSIISAFTQTIKFESGQIHLHNGEKKEGLIAGEFQLSEPKGLYFKPTEDAKEEYLAYAAIKEVRLGEQLRYITHCDQPQGQKQCYWLQIMVQGQASLYLSGANNKLYFFEENGVFTPIQYKTLPGLVNLLKKNCDGFLPNSNPKLDKKSMIDLVTQYNDCKKNGTQTQTYYNPVPPKFYWGPKLGINDGNAYIFETPFYHITDYRGKPNVSIGVVLNLQTKSNWAVASELNYLSRNITNDTFNFGSLTDPNLQTLKAKLSYLELPLFIQYRFLKGKIKPYLQGGVHTLFPIKRSFLNQSLTDPSRPPIADPSTKFTGLGFGYSFAAGLQMQLTEQSLLQINAKRALFSNNLNTRLNIYPERQMSFYFQQFQIEGSWLFRL